MSKAPKRRSQLSATSPAAGKNRTKGDAIARAEKAVGVPLHSPPQNIMYWGRILETVYNRRFAGEMQPLRTTISVWRVLTWLYEFEPLTVGEIAERSHIERTVVSRLLDRMSRQGLIIRTPNQNDRRISETRITPRGREAFGRMRPVRQDLYRRATLGIDPEQLELVCQVITRMIDNLGIDHVRFIRSR